MLSIPFAATYLLLLHVAQSSNLTIGKLGERSFPAGYYTYVGSARQHADFRLLRHIRGAAAKKRWHIDYLRTSSRCVGVCIYHQEQIAECQLAAEVSSLPGTTVPIPRFGASDCRCPAHLFYHGEHAPHLNFSAEPALILREQEILSLTEK